MQSRHYCLIPLRSGLRNARVIVGWTMVDPEDYERLSAMSWHRSSNGYARHGYTRNKKSGMIAMHRLVLGLEPGDKRQGDHINRNKLDNRRSNLRAVSPGVNALNTQRSWGTSALRGVSWDRRRNQWRAALTVKGKHVALGLHRSELEAGAAVERYRQEHLPLAPNDPALDALREAA